MTREKIEDLAEGLEELHDAVLTDENGTRRRGLAPCWLQPIVALIGDIQYLLTDGSDLGEPDLADVCEEIARTFRDEQPGSFAEHYRGTLRTSPRLRRLDARWRETFQSVWVR